MGRGIVSHRLWQYGLASPRTAVTSFRKEAALDARPGDVVRKRADKLYVGLMLGIEGSNASVRWAWQRNQSESAPLMDLERQLRPGEED